MSHTHPLQHAAAAARAGNSALAKVHLQKAAEADPDDPAVWLWMSWLSDSPMSMVQCLEMLLDNEQFRPAAEAGIHFAQTLNQFRHGRDIRTDVMANDTTHPQATPAQPSADPPQTVASPAAAPITSNKVMGSTHSQPTESNDAFRQDDKVKHGDVDFVDDMPTQQDKEVQDDIIEPRQIVEGIPEIVFEKSFQHASAFHTRNAQPEVPESLDTSRTLDVSPDSHHAHQAWSSEWAPFFANEETETSIEPAPEPTEQIESLSEPDRTEPIAIPTEMFRPACTNWFSPGGDSEIPDGTLEVQPAAPQKNSTSAGTFSASPDPTAPATAFNAPTVIQPTHQPSNESPPPVWRRPTIVRPPGDASTYEVPAVAPQESADSFVESPPVSGSVAPSITSILVVDDSPTVRKLVAMTLEKRGYRVVTAFDGVAAMKEIAAQNPALILMDVNMPRLDGYQLCKLVKEHDSTRHIPVILLSGSDGMFDRLRGRLVGCAGYISKPFVPEALVETVDQYLAQAAAN